MRELQTRFDDRVPNRYDTEKDLNDRLSGTICRYKGEPVYVRINTTKELWLNEITQYNGTPKYVIKPDDPEFDISSIEVGYANIVLEEENEAVYISRAPNRQYSQGLSGHYLVIKDIKGAAHQNLSGNSVMFTQGFKESLSGEFPPVDAALDILSSGKQHEVAVSQDVAVAKLEVGVLMVYYRTVNVGWAPPDSKTIHLTDSSLRWVVERHMGRFNWIIK